MRHLTSDELVDLAEGMREESSLPHLAGCDRCRRQLANLKAMMSAAAEVDVPEPSPLFWDHFSDRVRRVVATEADGRNRAALWRLWARWSSSRLMPAAAACAAVAGVVLAVRLLAPAPPPLLSSLPPTPPEDAPIVSAIAPLGVSDDPSLGLVADLAESLTWDDASQLQVMTHPGGADEAIAELTTMELQELHRLLKEAMEHPGA